MCVFWCERMKLIVWENVGAVCFADLLYNSIVTKKKKNSKMHNGCHIKQKKMQNEVEK